MVTFSFTPNTATLQQEPRTITARFGDGYEQRSADGINIRKQIWNLNFTGLTDTQADAIESALETANGVDSLSWTTPKGESLKFVCTSWNLMMKEPNVNDIGATFTQVFE